MADVKISALPPAPALTSTSIFAVVEGGVTYKATVTQVTAAMDLFATTATTKGLVPGSNSVGATYYLDATGNWSIPSDTGVTTISTIDSAAKSANGAVISGVNLIMQTADATNPGLVSTGTQTFAGSKTFSSAPTFTGFTAGSVLFAGASGLLSQSNTDLFWDNNNKWLGIGTATPTNILTIGITPVSSLQNSSATFYSTKVNDNNDFTLLSSTNTVNQRPVYQGIRTRGTLSSPSTVSSGDTLLTFIAGGFDGSNIQRGALLNFTVESAPSSGNIPTLIELITGANAGTRTAKLQVRSNGNVLIQNGGTFTDAGFRLDVNGTERVQGRLTVNQDTTVATQTVAVIQSGTTNASLVLNPNGTGALIADIPDGTAAGGNARGNYAVDLQIVRSLNTQVAANEGCVIGGGANNRAANVNGYATVGGGNTNSATGWNSTVAGGDNCTSSGSASFSVGLQNTASGNWSSVSGGQSNTASGAHSFVGGGQSNTAGTLSHAVVVGGNTNSASGQNSFVAGGNNNTASGTGSSVLGGSTNTASGSQSFAFGERSTASATYSSATGWRATAYLQGQRSASTGNFGAGAGGLGEAQRSDIIARREITGTLITELTLDGGAPAAGNRIILALPTGATNARMWTALIQVSAIVQTQGAGTAALNECFSGTYQCGIKRVGTTTSMIGNVTPTSELSDTNMVSSVVTIDADDTNEALRIQFTPPTTAAVDTVIRVVATAYLTEVGR